MADSPSEASGRWTVDLTLKEGEEGAAPSKLVPPPKALATALTSLLLSGEASVGSGEGGQEWSTRGPYFRKKPEARWGGPLLPLPRMPVLILVFPSRAPV